MLNTRDRTIRSLAAVALVLLLAVAIVPLFGQVGDGEDGIFSLRRPTDFQVFAIVLEAEDTYDALLSRFEDGPCVGIRLLPGEITGPRDYTFQFEFHNTSTDLVDVVSITFEYDGFSRPTVMSAAMEIEVEEGLPFSGGRAWIQTSTEFEFLKHVFAGESRLVGMLRRMRMTMTGLRLETLVTPGGVEVCYLHLELSKKNRFRAVWSMYAQVFDGPSFGHVRGLR